MLFGVPRETIMEEVHALAKRYVDEFAALPLPGVAGDASTPVLETTVALLTQEDLNQAAAATDGATESARTSPSTAASAPDSLAGGETTYLDCLSLNVSISRSDTPHMEHGHGASRFRRRNICKMNLCDVVKNKKCCVVM
jgi:hypothetical protein